jgi:hypothetical protein
MQIITVNEIEYIAFRFAKEALSLKLHIVDLDM